MVTELCTQCKQGRVLYGGGGVPSLEPWKLWKLHVHPRKLIIFDGATGYDVRAHLQGPVSAAFIISVLLLAQASTTATSS